MVQHALDRDHEVVAVCREQSVARAAGTSARDGHDVYPWKLKAIVKVLGPLARLARFADLDDQVEACRRVFAGDTRWTVERGSDLEEGESQGLPVRSPHVGDPILASNRTDASTSPSSWWKPSRTTSSCTSPRPSSAARRPPRSRTPPAA
jgi:hypothetical protein